MKFVDLDQDTPEWLEFRRNKIGASDAAAIMGVSPWKKRHRLWTQKVMGKEQPVNEFMLDGKRTEPLLREQFIRRTKTEVAPAVAIHDEYPWMIASFDGIHTGTKTLIEIKTTGNVKTIDEISKGKIPDYYMAQMQHQMAVSGYEKMFLIVSMPITCMRSSNIQTVEVKRDDEYIARLIEAEKAFWDSLQTLEEPEDTEEWEIRHDKEFRDAELEFVRAKCELDMAQARMKAAREELIEMCEEDKTKGISVEIRKIFSRGRVKYNTIPQLEGVDLNAYREPANESWRVEIAKT